MQVPRWLYDVRPVPLSLNTWHADLVAINPSNIVRQDSIHSSD